MNGGVEIVGVRFVLRHGSFLQWLMPKGEGRRIIKAWMDGSYKEGNSFLGSHNCRYVNNLSQYMPQWAVDMREVMAIHEFEVDAAGNVVTQPQMPGKNWGTNLSGVN